MSILTTSNRIDYTADGVATTFAFPFAVYTQTDLQVYVTPTGGTPVLQVLNTDYTQTAVNVPGGNAGGNVIFSSPPTNTYQVTLIRKLPILQQTSFTNLDKFDAKTAIEGTYDKVVMIEQQLNEVVSRAPVLPVDSLLNPEFPLPGASKFIRWNSGGTALEAVDITGTLPVSIDAFQAVATAGLPTAGQAGRARYVTDASRGLWIDQGSQWYSLTGGWFNVMEFGAKGNGTTDDTSAINATITAASDGDTIYFPRPSSFYKVTSTITVNKKLRLLGSMAWGDPTAVAGSQIRGTGFTLFTVTKPFIMENMVVYDPTGNASTIGIDINNGGTGVTRWTIKNCSIIAPTVTYGALGTGIRGVFALEGVIENSNIEGWLNGIDWQASGGSKSNANKVSGCKIRQNTIGMLVTSVDDAFLSDSVIEGNSTGVKVLSGKLACIQNHFENTVGNVREIHLVDGNLVSMNNGFFSAGADKNIYIEAGSGLHSSVGDTLNGGIKHNGTGGFTVVNPVIAFTVTGTGGIARIDFTGFTIVQGFGSSDVTVGSGANLVLSPGNDIKMAKALVAMGGGAGATLGTIGGSGPAAAGQNTWMRFLDSGGNACWVPVWK